MRKSFILILLTALLMTPLASTARDFKVTFANDNVEKVIAILEQATGYDFVGRKEVVSAAKNNVNGTYTASSIDDLLNDIVRAPPRPRLRNSRQHRDTPHTVTTCCRRRKARHKG